MGRAEYFDPVSQSRKPIKSGSIVSDTGLEYTPEGVKAIDDKIGTVKTDVKAIDDKIGILNGAGVTKEKANKSDLTTLQTDVNSHKADNTTIKHKAKAIGLDSTNFTSTNVEAGMNELFQSVSNGKQIVATAITDKGITTSSSASFSVMANNINSIGTRLDKIIKGNEQAGFYGIASNLITGNELFSKTGITGGTPLVIYDITWLKFSYQGKILFMSNRIVKKNISWDQIHAQGCVRGTKIITIDSKRYKVRLILGGNADPASTGGGEWDALIVPFAKDLYQWNYMYTLCQEVSTSFPSARVLRGGNTFDRFSITTNVDIGDDRGWSPVLELIP